MGKPWKVWLAFGICLAAVFVVMVWVSLALVRLDRAEIESKRRAAIEENVRLALWRMDSMLGQVVARENARPYFAYNPFYPAERAYTKMFAELKQGEILVPSPLLTENTPFIKLHFQFAQGGSISSPQVPTGNMRDLAESRYVNFSRIDAARQNLETLRKRLDFAALANLAPDSGQDSPADNLIQEELSAEQKKTLDVQGMRNQQEFDARRFRSNNELKGMQGQGEIGYVPEPPPPPETIENSMMPVWMNEMLLLVRKVSTGKVGRIQGCWLDWPALEKSLLGTISDLLPNAALEPVPPESALEDPSMLAVLPVKLVPGSVPGVTFDSASPVALMLFIAWGCMIIGAIAVAALLFGAMSLSERRGAFVSAVTHELRTPLTSFRIYSEMLKEGMVTDEEKRVSYLNRLHSEADRLSHLVENVLTYARLERGRLDRRLSGIRVGEILDRVRDQLTTRAAEAGMELSVNADEDIIAAAVKADASAIERILFNLTDNACKYAADAADKNIYLNVGKRGNSIEFRVKDCGPGISAKDARALFKPFRKSAKDAAHSAPGVGLGLSLSRRLARDMGGDLYLDADVRDGACFVLTLPASV
ncbi:MAG: sensor histidine kinase [Planctomycetota bacterium]|jgi:two-component sensor histidine kinase